MTGILRAALAAVFCLGLLAPVSAADYPNRPVRWLIGFAAGGPVDIVARIMSQWLSEHLGQQFVVENRAGISDELHRRSPTSAMPRCHNINASIECRQIRVCMKP